MKNKDYKEILRYLFFGVLTTAVNIGVFTALTAGGFSTVSANAVAWVCSVSFAYLTNRRWVFQSSAKDTSAKLREMGAFFLSRFSTGMLDMLLVVGLADFAGLPKLPVKIASNILIIVLNYVLGKLVIFRKKKQ